MFKDILLPNWWEVLDQKRIYEKELNMKKAYQIRIEPEQLEQLKKLAKENGTSVNHEIRQSIRVALAKK